MVTSQYVIVPASVADFCGRTTPCKAARGVYGFALPTAVPACYQNATPPTPFRTVPAPFEYGDRFLTASGSIERRAAAVRPERQERIPLGILYMISATAVFAASSAISKLLVVRYPVGEVLFARNIVGIVLVGGFVLPRFGLAVFETNKLPSHFARSVSQCCSQTFILLAFSMLPLAGAVAINFSAPLFATLVAAFMFREAV